jgi:hypothetical protein
MVYFAAAALQLSGCVSQQKYNVLRGHFILLFDSNSLARTASLDEVLARFWSTVFPLGAGRYGCWRARNPDKTTL